MLRLNWDACVCGAQFAEGKKVYECGSIPCSWGGIKYDYMLLSDVCIAKGKVKNTGLSIGFVDNMDAP